MDYTLILPPLTGAVIGWVTNWAAIKLLFRPHAPVRVLGYTFQGVIPKRRKEIARSIARAIESELLSTEDIASVFRGMEWKEEIEKALEEIVEHRLGSDRFKGLPVIGLVTENLKYHLKYLLTREVLKQVERKKDAIAARFKENIDINDMVVKRIDNLDLMRFEGLLTEFIARELKHLEYLGGVMGFFIGLAQSGFYYYHG